MTDRFAIAPRPGPGRSSLEWARQALALVGRPVRPHIDFVLMLAALFEHFLAARRARIAGRDGTILTAAEAACFGIVTTAFFGDTLWTKPFWLAWMILIWSINSGGSDRSSVRSIT